MSGRRLKIFGGFVAALGFAMLIGGAGQGSADTTETACPPTGKSICVSITDQAQASRTPTPDGPDHYLADFVTVSNGGSTSNLVNITVTITWKDLVSATTTSEYRPAFSDPRCTPVPDTTRTLSCTPPKSLGPGETATYGPLVFRTATDSAATDTELTVTATAKEQAVAKQGKNPPTAIISTSHATTYEGSADQDVSWAGEPGMNVTLATAPPASGQSGQYAKLKIPAGAMPAGDFATLDETACPAGSTTCIGQKITIVASGIAPVNLQIFYTGPLPSGLKERSLVVVHNGVSITRECSGEFFTLPTDLSTAGACRRASIDRSGPGDPRVIVDAWDLDNGDWTWG